VVLVVSVSCPKVTSTASVVLGRTIYQLLLREFSKSAVLDLVGTFHSTDGGECPARATRSLVLRRIYSTSSDPVYFLGDVYSLDLSCFVSSRTGLVAEKSFLFSVSHSAQEVVAQRPAFVLAVVSFNFLVYLLEESFAEVKLFHRAITQSLFTDVLDELNICALRFILRTIFGTLRPLFRR